MTGEWPLIGRDSELAELVDSLGRHGSVVIAGAAGVGKSRLAREVSARALGPGGRPVWVRGSVSAQEIPLGAFVSSEVWPDDGTPGADADVSLLRRTVRAVAALGPEAVVGVDDAHLLDRASATVIAQVVRDRGSRLVLTLRSGHPAPDAITALWKDDVAPRLDLEPLPETATAALAEVALGGPLDAAARGRLSSITRGNPLWLRHLLDGERRAGRLVADGEVWRWVGEPALSSALLDLVTAQLGDLTEPVLRALTLVSYGEPLGIDVLRRLVASDAVEEAVRRGLIVVVTDGRRREVHLAHPLYGEFARGRSDDLHAWHVRGELASALSATGRQRAGDVLRQAVLALGSDAKVEPGELLAAAARATALHDLSLAERLLRAARDRGGGFDAQLGLATVLGWLMRPDEAASELRTAVEVAPGEPERVRATLALVNNLAILQGRADDAHGVLDAATTASELSRRELNAIRATLELAVGRTEPARELAASVLDTPGTASAARAWAGFAATAHRALAGHGSPISTLADDAVAAAASNPETAALATNVRFLEVLGTAAEGRCADAELLVERVRDLPGEQGAVLRALFAGRLAFHTGRIRTSARTLTSVISAFPGYGGGWRSWLWMMVAQALGAAGDPAGARSACDRAEADAHPGMAGLFGVERGLAEVWTLAAGHQLDRARVRAGRVATEAGGRGQYATELLVRHTAVCLGDHGQLPALERLAHRLDGPRAPLAAEHARALGRRDAAGLLAVSRGLEDVGLVLLAADAAAQAAAQAAHPGSDDASAGALRRALDLAARCEGARTPALVAAGSSVALTPREREVAALAAEGLTNGEVAARLGVSPRTVESRIYRACARLGLSGRDAFVAAGRSGSPEADG